MDKNAIKKYAVWARRELIARVAQRAALYDITEKNLGDPNAESVRGNVLTVVERAQRQALIAQINEEGIPGSHGGSGIYLVQPFFCFAVYGSE